MKNLYEVRGDTTAVFVKNKSRVMEALVSTSKIEKVKAFPNTWYASWCPSRKSFYVTGHLPLNGGPAKNALLHRWVMDVNDPNIEVDHIDNDPLNNADSNLRLVTRSQNLQNRRVQRNNSSGYRGVCYHKKTGKWQANLRINGRYTYLGIYETKEEAAEAVIEARKKHMPFSKEAMGGTK